MKKVLIMSIFLTIVGLVIGFFYWFQLRPQEIRKTCAKEANDLTFNFESPLLKSFIQKDGNPINASSKEKNNYYRLCLTQHGMKPESLFVNLK